MFKYQINFAKYKLRGYEKELAIKEFEKQFPTIPKYVTEKGIEVETYTLLDEQKLKGLAFYCEFNYQNSQTSKSNVLTNQAILETYKNYKPTLFSEFKPNKSREIRYLTHSFHEYKGRFYPQLAKALMNYAEIKKGDTILDPFCGSGTTLVESLLYGANAVGIDINPIAFLLAKAKVRSLFLTSDDFISIRKTFKHLVNNPFWESISLDNYRHILDVDYFSVSYQTLFKRSER